MVFLEFFGAFITLLGVWLTARGKTSGWLAGIGGAAIYTYICFHSKLYAESTLQAIYAGMGFYGWLAWKNTQNTSFQVKTISTLTFSLNLLIWLLLTMFTGIVLEKYATRVDEAMGKSKLLFKEWMMAVEETHKNEQAL